MRILYFADIRFPLERANGIQTMETCHALAMRGHHVTLMVRPDSTEPARDPFSFYGLTPTAALRIEPVPRIENEEWRRPLYIGCALLRAVGSLRASVAFTRDLGVADALLRVPPFIRPPVVYESHGFAPAVAAERPDLLGTGERPSDAALRRLARRERRVWLHADAYVTITRVLGSEMAERYGVRRRATVVPDGVRIPAGHQFTPPDAYAPPVAAYAGHLYPWKGVDLFIEALRDLRGVQGLIIGGHPLEPDLARVQALAAQLGVAGRTTFTGLVPPADVGRLLHDARVLVLPNPASTTSAAYTSPLKLFEYMAAGRAIVASDLPAIREVLRDEGNALLVEPGNPHALAMAIGRLIEDPALAERLARRAFDDVAAFTWDRRAQRLEELFATLLQSP
jgi:glycosyltransferase involved in cell wall biosynthesis